MAAAEFNYRIDYRGPRDGKQIAMISTPFEGWVEQGIYEFCSAHFGGIWKKSEEWITVTDGVEIHWQNPHLNGGDVVWLMEQIHPTPKVTEIKKSLQDKKESHEKK